ncbi:MAG: type II toxin-antitoxin system RelE/ParE family toxin [Streptococcaceae bacterium]|nr:type II toxin-antitoxin system RelE/ParE family toxin [Streptococcaceae bacterium]
MDKPIFEVYIPKGHKTSNLEAFLKEIPQKDADKLLATVKNVQELGMLVAMRKEWVKRLNDDIFEIRSKVASNIQRALYFQKVGQTYIITHGFTKKTQKTPILEIEKAERIMKSYREENKNAD